MCVVSLPRLTRAESVHSLLDLCCLFLTRLVGEDPGG